MASEFNIRVVCRFRPLSEAESKTGSTCIVKFPTGTTDTVFVSGKVYMFDKVFGPLADQEKVYFEAAREIVSDVLNGYNGTIFAYGQTSSGKTHTMEGMLEDERQQGIIPRIVSDIFSHIYSMDSNLQFQIKVSYFEIYMDKIRDLLDPTKFNLVVHEDKNRVPYVKGCTERFVSSPEEVLCAIEEGKANRHIAVTNMNEHSSRSHSVFLINVKQENIDTDKKLTGKLYLVDLAGSEKVSKTGAEGSVLDEAKNINKSLSALGNVIAALADGTKTHVPYRDSKLTRILQESLGGNARTTIIICCSPASYNECETKSTLYFGQRAKMIKNTVVVNEELTAEEWKRRYDKEKEKVSKLRLQLGAVEVELEKWRNGETVCQDDMVVLDDSQLTMSQLTTNANTNVGMTDDERIFAEKERNALYQQLDEKDDEINQLEQKIAELKDQINEQDELLTQQRRENDSLQNELTITQRENDKSKDEVKELLSALEELAMNYEQKTRELRLKLDENESLIQEQEQKLSKLDGVKEEFDNFKECSVYQKKRMMDIFSTVFDDIAELGIIVNGCSIDVKKLPIEDAERLEEDITLAKMFINKLKTEVKTQKQKLQVLNEQLAESKTIIENQIKQIDEFTYLNKEQEVKINVMHETAYEMELRKRQMEEENDKLIDEIANLRTLVHGEQADERIQKELSEQHSKQLSALRNELSEKKRIMDDLRSKYNKLNLNYDKLQEEYQKLKAEDEEKKAKLDEYILQHETHEQAKQDLKGLEETVAKELQTLHNLRKLFVQDLQARMRKSHSLKCNSENDEEVGGNIVQKQKIAFLENNLDQLTKVHKQLVRDNADLRCELPKLEKRLKATMDRVKSLETALKEAKDSAMRDRKRYQYEVNKIKEAVRQRNLIKRANPPQIVKPIRAGQFPVPNRQSHYEEYK